MRTSILLAMVCVAFVAPLSAQSAPVAPGDRVKVWMGRDAEVYTVLEAGSGVLIVEGNGVPTRFELDQVTAVAVDRGARTRWAGARRGGTYGALIGGLGGAALGLADGDDRCAPQAWCFFELTAEEKALMGGILFGGVGALAGGVIGAIAPGRRWEKLGAPVELGLSPRGGGVALAARVRF